MQVDSGAVTRDHLLGGRLVIFQPRHGYRTSLDPILLASFVQPPFGCFLDLGAGSGAVSFVLLHRDPEARGIALELQPRLARLLRAGRDDNGFRDRLAVVLADARRPPLRALPAGARFDLIATNPPFQALGHGPVPAHPERRRAHHEETLTLSDWVTTAAEQLGAAGRLAAIFPTDRQVELEAALARHGLAPARRRSIRPAADGTPTRILVEAIRAAGGATGCQDLPDLIVHQGGGFSDEIRAVLGENANRPA